ncbi:unnamed protein product [Discosporangium mesarthrocarpum]
MSYSDTLYSSSSSSSSGSEENPEVDWESLESQLSGGALAALKDHLKGDNGCNGKKDHGERASATVESMPRPVLPDSNAGYKLREYWDKRFEAEEQYDWLLSYADVAHHIRKAVPQGGRILVVGCGNSALSADMYDDGYKNMVSTDFSEVVIETMRTRHEAYRPGLRWQRMDMLALDVEDGSIDAVIDKAAMDALMVDEGDVWDPDPTVVEQADRMCREISRVLDVGGVYLQISFAQPHFRRNYLSGHHAAAAVVAAAGRVGGQGGAHPVAVATGGSMGDLVCSSHGVDVEEREMSQPGLRYGWSLENFEVQREGGCFGNFVYIMRKDSGVGRQGGDVG